MKGLMNPTQLAQTRQTWTCFLYHTVESASQHSRETTNISRVEQVLTYDDDVKEAVPVHL